MPTRVIAVAVEEQQASERSGCGQSAQVDQLGVGVGEVDWLDFDGGRVSNPSLDCTGKVDLAGQAALAAVHFESKEFSR